MLQLFVLRARLQGGILNKARRGTLKLVLPMGFCYIENDTIVLDPDVQIQSTIQEVNASFLIICARAKALSRGTLPVNAFLALTQDPGDRCVLAERMTQDTLALTIAVQDELVQRAEEAQRLRHLQVERAQ